MREAWYVSRTHDAGAEKVADEQHGDLKEAGGDKIDIVHASQGESRLFVKPKRPTRTTTTIQPTDEKACSDTQSIARRT